MNNNDEQKASTGQREQIQNPYMFNPNDHLMHIKSKNGSADYLAVQWRLVWFRSVCPEGTIETEVIHLDLDRETEEESYAWNKQTQRSEKIVKRAPGFAVFRAVVKDGKGGVAMGTKSEKAASFPDYIEKAETGAIGRALAALGYGTQFTGDEFDERHRIVDAPVERKGGEDKASNEQKASAGQRQQTVGAPANQAEEKDPDGPVTAQQKASLEKLAQYLGKQNALPETYGQAKALLAQLSQEYKQKRQQQQKSVAS